MAAATIPASANAGTALMWIGFVHFSVGNLVIGLGEGLLLALLFRVSLWKCLAALIPANYASFIYGYLIVDSIEHNISVTLETAHTVFWSSMLLLYLVTLLVEFPFVAYPLWNARRRWLKAIGACLILQSLSYALLMWTYLDGPIRRDFFGPSTIVPLTAMKVPDDVVMYYIDPADGDVYRQPLGSGERTWFFDLNSTSPHARLAIVTDRPDGPDWRIGAVFAKGPAGKTITVKTPESGDIAALEWITMPGQDLPTADFEFNDTWWNFGRVPRLGAAQGSAWEFINEYWGNLYGRRQNESHSWAVETPFFKWPVRNATHLPNDIILFQLGANTIVLFDPNTEKIARVANGHGPIALLEPN